MSATLRTGERAYYISGRRRVLVPCVVQKIVPGGRVNMITVRVTRSTTVDHAADVRRRGEEWVGMSGRVAPRAAVIGSAGAPALKILPYTEEDDFCPVQAPPGLTDLEEVRGGI